MARSVWTSGSEGWPEPIRPAARGRIPRRRSRWRSSRLPVRLLRARLRLDERARPAASTSTSRVTTRSPVPRPATCAAASSRRRWSRTWPWTGSRCPRPSCSVASTPTSCTWTARQVRIATPFEEKRIGAVHRGAGPRDLDHPIWQSFDGYLQERAVAKGAHVIRQRVTGLEKSPDGLVPRDQARARAIRTPCWSSPPA